MSRLLDMKEFGEAAPFLRKTDLELLETQTVMFDGSLLEIHFQLTVLRRIQTLQISLKYLPSCLRGGFWCS